ncbi:MAG: cytidine deaminase [Bacteroidales bacterium]|nr:cytidine deaminase [Bacteroidales bacterium]
MVNKSIEIQYQVFYSLDEMDPADRELCEAAMQAQKTSYAPYSRFNVGAALRLADGRIVPGSNQENAASPSGLCAERTAMFAAGAQYPGVAMVSIAIVGGPDQSQCNFPATPCGSCRQVMAEYQKISKRPMSIILIGKKEIWKFPSLDAILPFTFTSLD